MKQIGIVCALVACLGAVWAWDAPGPGPGGVARAAPSQSSVEQVNATTEAREGGGEWRHTLYRVKGPCRRDEPRNYMALCGPVSVKLPGDLAAPAARDEPPDDASNPGDPSLSEDSEWMVDAGYVAAWGWWPAAVTTTVRAETEGRGVLMVIMDRANGREVVVQLGGDRVRVEAVGGSQRSAVLTTPRDYVQVGRGGDGQVTISKPVAATPGSALDRLVSSAMRRQTSDEP